MRRAWGIAATGVAAMLALPALPARSAPPPVTITIVGVGDVLSHREIIEQARADAGSGGRVDFRSMLEGVRPLVERADLAICHMEFALGSPRGPWTAWPDVPNSPPQLADAMSAVGFDACSTSSNHSLDQGFAGVTRTIEAIEGAGMLAFGTSRTKQEARSPRIIDVKGVPIGLLSYSYGWNGMPVPSEQPWCCPLIEASRIIDDARRARERGARLVVVSLHHGVEGVREPTSEQISVVRELAKSGAVDLVLGHHAHVVQPVDLVDGMWVAYGHGNLLSAQSRRDPRSGDGLLTSFTFAEQADGSFEVSRAAGYAVRNADFPFRLHVVGPRGTASQPDRGTWRRTREAVLLLDAQEKGFRLMRFAENA